ncbi:DUF932 domain-containing protein [Aliterella atlantica]|uniref:DUF932 domain-containing protein n=1 Tax=Aliterella atlantica CENA595 TaxID=1618023 RepID=A0A0D8ZN61_9CYAN|nr:DUF932 domain-containing protein [Aliterella atlantica]KJH69787.1 hypothetical protein UH38_22010 [Aliterella atlantica CENA595]
MKAGKTLSELALELERQSESKRDYIASTELLKMTDTGEMAIESDTRQELAITDIAHSQIASRLDIPAKYYQRMRSSAPELLAANVNEWFYQKPERRMVRTLDGQMRAYLSERYRRLDNYDLAEAVLPVLKEMGEGLKIISTELTASRMYVKVINERVELEVKKGDVVQAGMVISNSEVGLGSLKVEPLIYRLICANGMIAQDHSQKRYHVGRNAESDEALELYRDETLKADDRAFFLKVQDTVRAAVDIAKFSTIVQRMREATEQKIEGNPVKAVELVSQRFNFNAGESSGVLQHLIQGGDLSAYGMLNAITRTSQDLDDYERATDLERDGSRVLSLPTSAWKEIALAQ